MRLAMLAPLAAFLVLTDAALARSPARAECVRTFRFVTPEDWRCSEEGTPQCTICRNRSLRVSDVVVHCAADGTDERRPIPPGGTLAICGGLAS